MPGAVGVTLGDPGRRLGDGVDSMADKGKSLKRDTKTRILDAAEILFAENGFKDTSIYRLARKARVNQAAVNYHFGTKDALVEKVIERRLSMISQRRMENLRQIKTAAQRQDRRPEVHALLKAYIEPALTLTEMTPGERHFLVIVGRALAEPDEAIRNIFIRQFEPSFLLLAELMHSALPDLSESVLRWRLHFAIGSLAHVMRLCGSQWPVEDLEPHAADTETVLKLLITFLTEGMTAPAAGEDPRLSA
jgi:AcrR family transcriptional regulator